MGFFISMLLQPPMLWSYVGFAIYFALGRIKQSQPKAIANLQVGRFIAIWQSLAFLAFMSVSFSITSLPSRIQGGALLLLQLFTLDFSPKTDLPVRTQVATNVGRGIFLFFESAIILLLLLKFMRYLQRDKVQSAVKTADCARCGSGRKPGDMFCSNCGNEFEVRSSS